MSARRVSIKSSTIPGPYNILDMPSGQSIEFIAVRYEIGDAEREIIDRTERKVQKGPIMRVWVDLSTPVFGAPYVDILAGRTIMLLKTIFETKRLPLRLRLTASGTEPQKWYEVEVLGGQSSAGAGARETSPAGLPI
jgi:hypothetical protein